MEVEYGLDSPGDVFVFEQNLFASDADTVIGRNAGFCTRTDLGAPDFSSTEHPILSDDQDYNFGQCFWTLTFFNNSGYNGSIMVSGREADFGESLVSINGGTDEFIVATSILSTIPIPQG